MNLKKLARWKARRQSRLSFLLFSACTYLLCFAACLDFSQAGRFSTGWGISGSCACDSVTGALKKLQKIFAKNGWLEKED